MEWTTLVTDCEFLLYGKAYGLEKKRRMHLSEAFSYLISHRLSLQEILILTNRQETLNLAKRLHVPMVGLEMDNMVLLSGIPYILQEIGEESLAFLERVYKRYYELPVVIAKTEHLFIREMIRSDTEHLYRLYQCEDVQGEVAQSGLNREELFKFVESYRKIRYPFYNYGMWILEERKTGEFVGEAGIEEDSHWNFGEIGEGKICLEAGYAICPKFRGRGYAAEALNAIAEIVRKNREVYGVLELGCYIRIGNLASVRTALRCGFVWDGGRRYGDSGELERYRLEW